jgi:hypothetical protein
VRFIKAFFAIFDVFLRRLILAQGYVGALNFMHYRLKAFGFIGFPALTSHLNQPFGLIQYLNGPAVLFEGFRKNGVDVE